MTSHTSPLCSLRTVLISLLFVFSVLSQSAPSTCQSFPGIGSPINIFHTFFNEFLNAMNPETMDQGVELVMASEQNIETLVYRFVFKYKAQRNKVYYIGILSTVPDDQVNKPVPQHMVVRFIQSSDINDALRLLGLYDYKESNSKDCDFKDSFLSFLQKNPFEIARLPRTDNSIVNNTLDFNNLIARSPNDNFDNTFLEPRIENKPSILYSNLSNSMSNNQSQLKALDIKELLPVQQNSPNNSYPYAYGLNQIPVKKRDEKLSSEDFLKVLRQKFADIQSMDNPYANILTGSQSSLKYDGSLSPIDQLLHQNSLKQDVNRIGTTLSSGDQFVMWPSSYDSQLLYG